jgi:hypothetical protein
MAVVCAVLNALGAFGPPNIPEDGAHYSPMVVSERTGQFFYDLPLACSMKCS